METVSSLYKGLQKLWNGLVILIWIPYYMFDVLIGTYGFSYYNDGFSFLTGCFLHSQTYSAFFLMIHLIHILSEIENSVWALVGKTLLVVGLGIAQIVGLAVKYPRKDIDFVIIVNVIWTFIHTFYLLVSTFKFQKNSFRVVLGRIILLLQIAFSVAVHNVQQPIQ